MAGHNTYLKYKRDQKLLVYWIIHTSNRIVKLFPSERSPPANTTGQISLSTLVSLSQLIAKHINPIPATIYRLFRSIIAARQEIHAIFRQLVAKHPDPETEKSNVSHKHWIDGLTEALKALGGELWISEQKNEIKGADEEDEEDEEEAIFTNIFSALRLDGEEVDEDDEVNAEEETKGPSIPAAPARRKKKPTRRGKKGKRGRKPKGKPESADSAARLDEVPLEAYRIIEDESGLVTDYLMAVYSLITHAVAGAISNIALGMIKHTESRVFVDFPGHDSYETVMKTITRGDPEKAQGNFHLGLYAIKSGSKVAETVHDVDIDVKEDFLIHTYRALVDFITDFQQTRSGKPSKSMLAQIQNWDPAFDLQRATNEQRLRWRRAYTINWLYDLVNLFSSIVVQRRTLRGQNIALEGVDWSVNGPWNEHRRLFGLNEFAGDITHLAMQTPGTNIRPKILPHHVFQLQCIVDSLSVSRGWLLNSFKGHVIIPPAPGFRPRRDVDLFMDRKNERSLKGFCAGADVLYQLFEKDAMLHGNPNRHKQRSEILDILRDDFVNWLGETKYMYGLTTIPPSRFSNSNSNGLWEYSPYLCGVGLMEALELAYNMGFLIWDEIPEPMCLIHLHNMLVQKGYITKPVGLYASLQELFPSSFFASGKVPTSNFSEALFAVLGETNSRRVVFNRKSLRRQAAQTSDIHGLLSTSLNRFFKTKSLLTLYRGADWVPDRIPDEEVPLVSLLAILRIGQTKRVTDPATGKTVLQETELVKRARSMGMDDATMMMMSSIPESGEIQETPESILSTLPEGYKPGRMLTAKRSGSAFNGSTLSSREVLTILKRDLMSDVSSVVRPLSSLNYVCVTVQFMFLFQRIEDELKRLRNPLWVEVYETNSKMAADKRATFTLLALAERNEECMEVMAKVFQDLRIGFLQHVYWDNLEPVDAGWDFLEEDEPEMTCTIM